MRAVGGMIADIARTVKRLLGYMRGAYAELLLRLSLSAAVRFITTWMIADLLAGCIQAIEMGDAGILWPVLGTSALWFALAAAMQAISVYLNGRLSVKATANMRSHLMEIMLRMPMSAMGDARSGARQSLFVNDIPAATGSIINTLASPVNAFFMGLGGLVYVLSVHPAMAVVALVIGCFTFIYSVFFAKALHALAQRTQALLSDFNASLKVILDGMVAARMYGLRARLERDMDASAEALMDTGTRWARLSGYLGGVNNAVSALSDAALLFAAGLLFFAGETDAPTLIRVSQMAGGVIGVFHVSRLLVDVQKSVAGAERVFAVIDGSTSEPEHSGVGSGASIYFKGVSFSYNSVKPVLRDVSFRINDGEAVAITGPSGSGKSTVLRLIQGLYTPDEGAVAVGGLDVSAWSLDALRRHTALVQQEPVLFNVTLAENIAFGTGGMDMDRVIASAKAASIHDFIASLPEGYETPVAERGASLSGGERQRVAIARALYRGASILLMDEATAAVDAASESALYDALQALKGRITIVNVTHKTEFLSFADRIIALDK